MLNLFELFNLSKLPKLLWHQVASLVLSVLLSLPIWVGFPAAAQAQMHDDPNGLEQPFPVINKDGLLVPDWSKINFDTMPPMSESGAIQVPPEIAQQLGFDPSTSWQAGDRISTILKTGNVAELGVGNLNLDQIHQAIGVPLESVSLDQFGVMPLQTIESLVVADPLLSNLPIDQVAPVVDLLTASGLGIPTGATFSEAIAQFPDLANLSFAGFDLSTYGLESIPGLAGVNLGNFKDWQNALIDQIPGLSELPFDQLTDLLDEATNPFIARIDVPLGDSEADRIKSVSGSFQAGFNVPCEQDCSHAELSPIAGSQMDVAHTGAFGNGKAWMASNQLVEGGFGILKIVNAGQEPTGRNPYGSVFKQVVTRIDQPRGVIETSLYFRYCRRGFPDLGCTPYFLGPVPFIHYPEKMFIYMGPAAPKDDGQGLSLGGNGDVLGGGGSFNSCGGKLTGGAVDVAVKTVDQIAATMGAQDGALSTSSDQAKQHIPGILAALRAEGITCPAQVSYVLATVNRETSFVNFEEGDTRYKSDSEGFWGRGYVQITHREAYQRASNELGIDLVSNPDRAKEPAVAAQILAKGFKQGWFGNQQTIDQMIPCQGSVNYAEARKMINDSAQAEMIAQVADMYYEALSSSDQALDKAEVKDDCATRGAPSAEGWYDPMPGAYETSVWGQYLHGSHFHQGADLAKGNIGEPIFAARAGRVDATGPGNCPDNGDGCGDGYGNWISIIHDNGYSTFYAHNHRLLVHTGDQVKGGQQISQQGSSGSSTGPHLHFEVCPSSGGCGRGTRVPPSKVGIPHPFSKVCESNRPGSPSYCG